jgi:hypothetical protein
LESSYALIDSTVYWFGGFGSEKLITNFIPTTEGLYVRCERWAGKIEKFRELVFDMYGGGECAGEFLAIGKIAERRSKRALQAWKNGPGSEKQKRSFTCQACGYGTSVKDSRRNES